MSTINPVLGYYFFLSKDKGLSNPKALLLIKHYTRLHGELTMTPIVTVEERENEAKLDSLNKS